MAWLSWTALACAARTGVLHDHSHQLVPYRLGLQWQERVVAARLPPRLVADGAAGATLPAVLEARDSLILLQHEPVLTLGTGSTTANILTPNADLPFDVIRTTRGGEVTYHGPGQLVAYPILDLRTNHEADLHWYLRTLEEVVIGTLAEFGVAAARIDGLTGVWVGERKLCAIGVKVSKWVTMHGLALNVRTNLDDFAHIVPCGISGRAVGSLEQLVPGVLLADVRNALLYHFGEQFAIDRWESPVEPLPDAAGQVFFDAARASATR